MRQLDDQLLQAFMERLNAKLMDEARMRAKECERGLETPELGGLVIQKVGQGMAAAVDILSGILDQRIPARSNRTPPPRSSTRRGARTCVGDGARWQDLTSRGRARALPCRTLCRLEAGRRPVGCP